MRVPHPCHVLCDKDGLPEMPALQSLHHSQGLINDPTQDNSECNWMRELSPLAGVLVIAMFWHREGALRERALHGGAEHAVSCVGDDMGIRSFTGLGSYRF